MKEINQQINQQIQQLDYDPATILVFNGEEYSTIVTEGTLENNQYIVAQREKVETSNSNYDIAIMDSMSTRTYPGALLLANEALVNNMPSFLYSRREPVTLRINLPGMEEDGTVLVFDPSYSDISAAINLLTNTWFDKYDKEHKTIANYSYTESQVYNQDHLQAIVGFDLGQKLNLDFTKVSENIEQIFVLTFKQIFYNVAIDGPEQPGGFFSEEETWDDLVANGVSNQCPPVYVANVAYGRTVYVSIRTSNMSDEIKANLKLAIKEGKLDISVINEKLFENSEYSAIVLGGSSEGHIPVVTKDFDKIEKLILENSEFSKKNQGAPISYTAVFLKENAIAVINSSATYVKTTYSSYNSGLIHLDHVGGYIAKFYVNWDEIEYVKGEEIVTSHSWEKNGDNLTAPFNTTIPLPANTTNIHVKATEKTGLVWEPWRTVVDQDVTLVPNIYVKIWGTTLNPKSSVKDSL